MSGKSPKMWRLNYTLLNNMSPKRNLKRNVRIFQTKWNENIPYQNLWDEAKAVFRIKFIVLNAYIRK